MSEERVTLEMNRLYNMDCRDGLQQLPNDSIDCVVTTPPYYMLRGYRMFDDDNEEIELGHEESVDEYITHLCDIFDQILRVLKPSGTLWLNTRDTYSTHSLNAVPSRLVIEMMSRGWYLKNHIAWNISNAMPVSSRIRRLPQKTETIFFLVKDSDRHYFHRPADQDFVSNVWTVLRRPWTGADRFLRSALPREIVRTIIELGCPLQGVVLDPFAGMATTLITARQMHRNFVGFEIAEVIFHIAEQRIQDLMAQSRITDYARLETGRPQALESVMDEMIGADNRDRPGLGILRRGFEPFSTPHNRAPNAPIDVSAMQDEFVRALKEQRLEDPRQEPSGVNEEQKIIDRLALDDDEDEEHA